MDVVDGLVHAADELERERQVPILVLCSWSRVKAHLLHRAHAAQHLNTRLMQRHLTHATSHFRQDVNQKVRG